MIKNYDQEIEKYYRPENFAPDELAEAERLVNWAIQNDLLSPEDCADWTDENYLEYYHRSI